MTLSDAPTLTVTDFGSYTAALAEVNGRLGLTLLRGEERLLHCASPLGCELRDMPLVTYRRGDVFFTLTSTDGCQNESYGRGIYLRGGVLHIFAWEEDSFTGFPISDDPVMGPILDAEVEALW